MSFDLPFELPNGWELKTVEQLVNEKIIEKPLDGNHGGIHPKSSDYVEEGIPFVMASDLEAGRVDFHGCKFITEQQANTLRKGFSRAGDVLISHKATIGRTAIVQESNYPFIMLTPQVTYYRVTDEERLSNIYLKAYFDSHFFQSLLALWAGAGSTRAYLGITGQLKLPVILPPIDMQIFIANHAFALDKKIEINRQTNQTLEQIAQAIFKSWFVDFDPVKAKIAVLEAGGTAEQAELAAMSVISAKDETALKQLQAEQPAAYAELAKTAALFPSKMVDSELGEIPEGWDTGAIEDVVQFSTKRLQVSELSIENYISTENMLENKKGITTASSIPSGGTVPEFNEGDILVSNIRPYFKKIWLAKFKGGRSPDVLGFSCIDKDEIYFAYNLLYQDSFFEYMMTTSKGAKMPRGDKDAIKLFNFPLPQKELRIQYSKKVRAFYPWIKNSTEQIDELQILRDTLLPKLVSGELIGE